VDLSETGSTGSGLGPVTGYLKMLTNIWAL